MPDPDPLDRIARECAKKLYDAGVPGPQFNWRFHAEPIIRHAIRRGQAEALNGEAAEIEDAVKKKYGGRAWEDGILDIARLMRSRAAALEKEADDA